MACYAFALYPSFRLARHHELVIRMLERMEQGKIRRGMIFLPPRHSKTLLATQLFPAYYLGRHPDRSVISVTYGQELSDDFGQRVRGFVTDPLHSAIFPRFRLSADCPSVRKFSTTAGGSYYAVGRGGPITGRGAHLLLIDDALKDHREAGSEDVRRHLHEWYSAVAYPRLRPEGAVLIIQTRWHQDDLAGWLLREHKHENWDVLSMSAIAEENDGFRCAGQALWPEQYPVDTLNRIRLAIGTYFFKALYQQQPPVQQAQVFKREWWQYYDQLSSWGRCVHSWDTAFKTGAENDYSVCTIWGIAKNNYFLLSFWRGKLEFPALKKTMCQLAKAFPPSQILLEDKASGHCLIQELKYATALPIIPIKVDRDKRARAEAATPLIEAGRVFLPRNVAWVSDYIDEMAAFPEGSFDDAVDSTTQALNYLRHEIQDSVSFSIVRL